MKNTYSSYLRYLKGIIVLLFLYPVVQTFAVTDNKDDVLSGNQQASGILAVKRLILRLLKYCCPINNG